MKLSEHTEQLWVAATANGHEDGTFENPYSSLDKAIQTAQPGQSVVIKGGMYSGDVTIQNSGTMDRPIRIVAQEGAEVQWSEACWYFYDVTDIICSGITFKDSPGMAIAVMGKCERNKFELLTFTDCSLKKKEACTMFFGGSGQACNIVESCQFIQSGPALKSSQPQSGVSIGIMIAEGDFQMGEANRDCIICNNRFKGYGYGILLGSHDSLSGLYGHRVLFNTIEQCGREGIMAKCGDTLIKGNTVRNCPLHSIRIAAGEGSVAEDNRVVDCGSGIVVAGSGHTVSNNCIIRARHYAIAIAAQKASSASGAPTVIVEGNTLVDWGNLGAAIIVDSEATGVVCNNLAHGRGKWYDIVNHSGDAPSEGNRKKVLFTGNAASKECEELPGGASIEVSFVSSALDNYANESGYGAKGRALSPEAYDGEPVVASDCRSPSLDEAYDAIESEPHAIHRPEGDASAIARSIFLPDED